MKQLKNLKFLNNKIIQSNGKDNKTDSDIKLSDPKYNQQEHSKELTATTTDEISDIEEPIDDLKELLRRARRIDKISSRTSCAEIIFNKRLISKEQLRKAIKIQEESGGYFHQVLADMAIIPKKSILEIAAEGWGIGGYLDLLETRNVDPEVVKLIPESKARQILGIPVFINETRLSVAMANPLDIFIVDDIKRILRMKGLDYEIDTLLALPKDIEKKLEEIYGLNDEFVHSILEEIQGDNITVESVEEVEQEDDFDIARSLEAAQKGPVINLVNAIFLNAVKMSATDIHIEPFRKRTVLRFRIDGSMQEIPKIPIPKARHAAVASRIKIMAGCDISERRLPQDGRIQFTAAGKEYDVRVSVIPTASFGESIVMRIADRGSTSLSLTQLGFSTGNLKIFEDAISKPHGIILVTGPTGSGKTTTLYSALNTINKPEIKILTVENPVERHLEGAVQIQVKSEIGLDFAEVLRNFLRHDPDVIMVGEIRDKETATTAIEAALTGHLVFATLHTNDAPSSIIRLIEMGISEFLLASSVQIAMAQRLVRKICTKCKTPVAPTGRMLREMQACGIDTGSLQLQKGVGCSVCRESGFKGVTSIHEIFCIDDEIIKLILKGDFSGPQLRELARSKGMRTLREDGMEKVAKGITTFEEVILKTTEE